MSEIQLRVKRILEELAQTNEDLLALADDIWLSIDHNDNEALQEGVSFKAEYNEKVAAFDQLSSEISKLVEGYMGLDLEVETEAASESNANQRIIKALDKHQKHSLDENFTYKKPFGFSIEGKGYQNVGKWKLMYFQTLKYLCKEKDNFRDILDAKEFRSNRGNKDFSSTPTDLRIGQLVSDGIYAETNLSANQIRDRIKKLLKFFDIPIDSFVIYLKEDRDWNET